MKKTCLIFSMMLLCCVQAASGMFTDELRKLATMGGGRRASGTAAQGRALTHSFSSLSFASADSQPQSPISVPPQRKGVSRGRQGSGGASSSDLVSAGGRSSVVQRYPTRLTEEELARWASLTALPSSASACQHFRVADLSGDEVPVLNGNQLAKIEDWLTGLMSANQSEMSRTEDADLAGDVPDVAIDAWVALPTCYEEYLEVLKSVARAASSDGRLTYFVEIALENQAAREWPELLDALSALASREGDEEGMPEPAPGFTLREREVKSWAAKTIARWWRQIQKKRSVSSQGPK